MVNRGVFDEINGEGLIKARFNNLPIRLKPERYRPYVAEQFKEAEPADPETIEELSKTAIINTIEIADPEDPDTIWGFVTEESLKHSSNDIL